MKTSCIKAHIKNIKELKHRFIKIFAMPRALLGLCALDILYIIPHFNKK